MEDDKKKAQEALKELLGWLRNSRQLFSDQQNLVLRCSYLISETTQDAEEKLEIIREAVNQIKKSSVEWPANDVITVVERIIDPPKEPEVGDTVLEKSNGHGRIKATVVEPHPDKKIIVVDDGIGNIFPVFADKWEVVE